MGQFYVNRRYSAMFGTSALQLISLEADTTVEVDDEVAEWVERDSPGVLSVAKGASGATDTPESGESATERHGDTTETKPVRARRGGKA